MKNLLVPQAGANVNTVPSHNNNCCDFQQDALLGFGLDLPDEQLDNAVLQLQAASCSIEQQHNNSNTVDYHPTLLQCVELLPPMSSAAALPMPSTTLSGVYRTALDDAPKFQERCDFAAETAASELVDVADKDCDSLAKLAYNLWRLAKEDHIVIDRKRNEVVRTDAHSNQKTIYRCMDPIGMGMRHHVSSGDRRLLSKAGRPRKRTATATATAEPALVAKKAMPEPTPDPDDAAVLRTRSGRIVRAIAMETETKPVPAKQLQELKDKDYRCSSGQAQSGALDCPPPAAVPERRARSVPLNAICPGCNKVFLGRRLDRHYVKFPEHMPRPATTAAQPQPGDCTLFGLLTAQLQRHAHLSEEQRADLFLHELNDFVEQLQLRSTRLIRNTSGLHFVNTRIARVLGIPEGQYALDMSAMESAQPPAPEPELALLHANAVNGARNMVDYTGLSMSLDDTLTDEAAQRLNLSAGGKLLPPSEESLLRNVGDLMQPPVAVPATVGEHVASVNGALLPHYDHASDNAVEALSMKETPNAAILDLNVEFFQFNN